MKLFQKLLLGPVAVGLLSPIAASASEANLDDVTSYAVSNSDITRDSFKPLSSKNPLLAGGEGLNNNPSNGDFDGDTFSSTTSASFESNWAAGAVDGLSNEEKLGVIFDYKIALTTSFTGNDSLDVEFEAGRGDDRLAELDFAGSGVSKANSSQTVKLDSISYTTTLGDKATFFLGHGTPGSALYSSACKYSGVGTTTLSDCGQASSALDVDDVNSAFGASIDLGRGFTAAAGYEGEGSSSDGLMTNEGVDAVGVQVAYAADNYGFSYTFANIDNNDGAGALSGDDTTSHNALNAYYSPNNQNLPSISFGYEWSHDDSKASSEDQTTNYFIGIQWDELGDGTLGAAIGTKTPTAESSDDLMIYEAFYSYNYADGITITPLFFVKENSGSTSDETGIVLKSTFEF